MLCDSGFAPFHGTSVSVALGDFRLQPIVIVFFCSFTPMCNSTEPTTT